jgi:hypothetical protein
MNSQEPRVGAFKKPRRATRLDDLERSLSAYAAAAAAAGVSLLALAPSAEAKIVYTRAHVQIPFGHVPLDLNHDRIADFSLFKTYLGGSEGLADIAVHVAAPSIPSNRIWGRGSFRGYLGQSAFASALRSGFKVGPSKSCLQQHNGFMASFFADFIYGSTTRGQWLYAKNRYLGLKFMIHGQVHYGWARLTVSWKYPLEMDATLTGYAYETIPNKPIITGKIKGPDVVTLDSATLGQLAVGASSYRHGGRTRSKEGSIE